MLDSVKADLQRLLVSEGLQPHPTPPNPSKQKKGEEQGKTNEQSVSCLEFSWESTS